MLKNKKLTKKDLCDKWLTNKTINPETSRKIKENGDVYKKLEKLCSLNQKLNQKPKKDVKITQKDLCDKWLTNKTINPETSRKIKENGDVYKKLEKLCSVKSSSNSFKSAPLISSSSDSFKTAPLISSSSNSFKTAPLISSSSSSSSSNSFKTAPLISSSSNSFKTAPLISSSSFKSVENKVATKLKDKKDRLKHSGAIKALNERLKLEQEALKRYSDNPKKYIKMQLQIQKTINEIDKLTVYKIPILANINGSNRILRILQNNYIEFIKNLNKNRITWSRIINFYNEIINHNKKELQKTDVPKERTYLQERILTTTKIIQIYIRKMNYITKQIDVLSKIETETKNFVNKFSKNELLSTIEFNNEREIRFSNMMIRILENKTKQTTNPIKRNYNSALIFEYNNYIQYIEMIKHNINQIKFVIIKSTNVINSPPNIKKKKNSFELKLEQREISIKERAAIVEQQKIYVEQLSQYLSRFPRNNEIFNKYITYNALYNQALEERAANTVGITGRLFKTKETQREMNYKYEIANINSKAYYANMKLFKNLYEDKQKFIKNHYAKIMNQPSVAKMKETEQQLKITDGSLINSLYIIPSSFDEKESINEAKRISDLKKNEEKEKERLEKESIANTLLMKKARNDYKDARIRSREANQRLLSDLINKQRIRSREVN